MEGGTLWSETTLVIFIDAYNSMSQNYRRQPNGKLGEIQFQLHQVTELPHMLLDSDYDKYTTSMTLGQSSSLLHNKFCLKIL